MSVTKGKGVESVRAWPHPCHATMLRVLSVTLAKVVTKFTGS